MDPRPDDERGDEYLELDPAERARYFAPTMICGYLAGLCLALAALSPFLRWPGAIALTAVGLLGALLLGLLALAVYRAQQRDRRYQRVVTGGDATTNFERLRRVALEAGWRLECEVPGRLLEARTPGALLMEGERVSARFAGSEVRLGSICDPAVGFSLVGRRRCLAHRRRLLAALEAPPASAAGRRPGA
ncbi:MAG: hypothetical protein JSR73_17390 [Proteobacteria bacterium]|nr:hypothetical protein [Pseudomonadota bacterium]